MTAKFPGDCRNAGELPQRYFTLYVKHLRHGQKSAYAHALACWREDLVKAAAKGGGAGLFGGGGK